MAVGVVLREEVLQNVTRNCSKIDRKSKITYAMFRAPEKHVKWIIKDVEKEYKIQPEWGAKNNNFAWNVLRKSRFGAHENLQSKSKSLQKRTNVYIPCFL